MEHHPAVVQLLWHHLLILLTTGLLCALLPQPRLSYIVVPVNLPTKMLKFRPECCCNMQTELPQRRAPVQPAECSPWRKVIQMHGLQLKSIQLEDHAPGWRRLCTMTTTAMTRMSAGFHYQFKQYRWALIQCIGHALTQILLIRMNIGATEWLVYVMRMTTP